MQKDVEEMSDFLVLKSTEEQRAEGVESPLDTAYIDDRDGLPILKAVFDIHHFQPDDVMLTVENAESDESDGEAQRQLVLCAQLTDDSRECSLFKKVGYMYRKNSHKRQVSNKRPALEATRSCQRSAIH